MVFSFSWLAEEMMNGHGQGTRKIFVKVEIVERMTTIDVNKVIMGKFGCYRSVNCIARSYVMK